MVGDVRIARGEFQMTGAAERKEREPKLVPDGVHGDKKVLVRGAKRTE